MTDVPGPRCVWATSQDWESPFRVSARHLMEALAARGWSIAALSHPVSPLHLLSGSAREGARRRLREWRGGGGSASGGRIRHWCPMTLLPPHTASPLSAEWLLDAWPRLALPSVRSWLRRNGFDRADVVVLDSERYGFLLDVFPAATSVLRVVDDLAGFPNVAPSWVRRQRRLADRVDVVLATAPTLVDDLREAGVSNVQLFPHGVDLGRFATPTAPPPEYEGIPAPRAIYVGALEQWFDPEWIRTAAEQAPEISFVIVGAGGADLSALTALENVHLLGRRPYDAVPAFLQHADVGLIPFRDGRLSRSVNPLKLYEYLAAGLPVVTSDWAALRDLDLPADRCATAAEFAVAIRRAAAESTGGDRASRIGRVTDLDWSGRAAAFEATLNRS